MPREPKPPVSTTPERSRIMRAVRRCDTGPERMLQCGLRRLRLRFSKNSRDLPGSPDIVFRESRVAVFVHGCFWHRHKECPLATTPGSNIGYWRAKFAANRERDRRKLSELKRLGWKVIVVWQCEIEADAGKAAQRIEAFLRRAQKTGRGFDSSLPSPLVVRKVYGEDMGLTDGLGCAVEEAPNKPMKLPVAFGARSFIGATVSRQLMEKER